jgi:hypothetical protein
VLPGLRFLLPRSLGFGFLLVFSQVPVESPCAWLIFPLVFRLPLDSFQAGLLCARPDFPLRARPSLAAVADFRVFPGRGLGFSLCSGARSSVPVYSARLSYGSPYSHGGFNPD